MTMKNSIAQQGNSSDHAPVAVSAIKRRGQTPKQLQHIDAATLQIRFSQSPPRRLPDEICAVVQQNTDRLNNAGITHIDYVNNEPAQGASEQYIISVPLVTDPPKGDPMVAPNPGVANMQDIRHACDHVAHDLANLGLEVSRPYRTMSHPVRASLSIFVERKLKP